MGRIRSCYISSPAGTDLIYIREALVRRGIHVVVPDDMYPGGNWSEWINSKITEVDLVIGVLTQERRSQWVLFELGQAAALGRQIVLIAPPKLASVPSHLKQFLVVRASPRNRDAIEFALDQILASPDRPYVKVPTKPPEGRTLGTFADEILDRLRSALVSNDYRSIERNIAEAIRHAGSDIVSESEAATSDLKADIAVWSDALQPFVGNPLLIEVKARVRSTNDLRKAAQQLSSAVLERGGVWGLLLYGEGPNVEALGPKGLPPTVLVLSIENFIEELRARSFPEVIRTLRNRRVHGGES